MKPRAYGIVRTDIAPSRAEMYVDDIRALAGEKGWELRAVFQESSDASFPLLVATLGLSGIAALVVPSAVHITGWMDVIRQSADVWTLQPQRR